MKQAKARAARKKQKKEKREIKISQLTTEQPEETPHLTLNDRHPKLTKKANKERRKLQELLDQNSKLEKMLSYISECNKTGLGYNEANYLLKRKFILHSSFKAVRKIEVFFLLKLVFGEISDARNGFDS